MASGVNVGAAMGLAVAAVFDVLMPVAVVLWARRRLGVAWKVVGWGAAMTDASAELLSRLPEDKRNAIMAELFGRANGGLGF